MYQVHAMPLKFCAEFRQKLIIDRYTWVGFLPVEYDEDYSSVQLINELVGSANATNSETPKMVLLENITPQTIVSNARDEMMKEVHGEYNQFWVGFRVATMRFSR